MLFQKNRCLFSKNRVMTPALRSVARECCTDASSTSDFDFSDNSTLVMGARRQRGARRGSVEMSERRGSVEMSERRGSVEMSERRVNAQPSLRTDANGRQETTNIRNTAPASIEMPALNTPPERPLRTSHSTGMTRQAMSEVANAVKASYSEGVPKPAADEVERVVVPQERKKRSMNDVTLVDYLFCVGRFAGV